MTEKKKIIVWAVVAVLLLGVVLFVLFGGKKGDKTNADATPGVETELQQGEGSAAENEAAELTKTPTSEQITEPVPEPTREPEATRGVIELPFIPVQ